MGASYWQSTHLSLCPPRAAVRQLSDVKLSFRSNFMIVARQATFNSPKCLHLLIAEDGVEAFQKLLALYADDVGHFDGRPHHGRRGR